MIVFGLKRKEKKPKEDGRPGNRQIAVVQKKRYSRIYTAERERLK
jgi:hypothetical protein